MASLVDGEDVTRQPLLLYLASALDPQRFAIAPALAALAERRGWEFELYYAARRAGRHFGGGPPEDAGPGWPAGSLAAGGRHADHARRLAEAYDVVFVGDRRSPLTPGLGRAEGLAPTSDPLAIYTIAFERLGEPLPGRVLVVDAAPAGRNGLVVAPYLYPTFLSGEPALGLEASGEALGDREHHALDPGEGDSYEEVTASLAERHAAWGRGILLGDPELVASQLPRARRLRLLPLYGRPQVDAVRRAARGIRHATEPVWGRQYDDRDFLALAELGHGLQVLDPGPPFTAPEGASLPSPAREPSDDELRAWAAEGRVLATVLFWCGMVREEHCLAPIVDLVAATGLRAGLILTLPALEAADPATIALLGVPPELGGVAGLLEPLAGSTGFGVAAEALLPDGVLAATLGRARTHGLGVRGWWPLLDAPLVPHGARRLERRGLRPVIRFTPRSTEADVPGERPTVRDPRALVGAAVRRLNIEGLFEERRPFDDRRPGLLDRRVADAV